MTKYDKNMSLRRATGNWVWARPLREGGGLKDRWGTEGTEVGVLAGGGRGDFGAVLHLSALLPRHPGRHRPSVSSR